MFKRRCKITFIRHGSTFNTDDDRLFDDETYPPLNENGRLEMEKIAEWIKQKGLKNDKIYTSSALRTVQSARILSKYMKQDYEILEKLKGRKAGLWSGLTFDEIEAKYPNLLEKYHKDPEKYWPKGGENTESLNKRVKKILEGVVEQNIGKRIIIVTHGEVIQSAVASALDIPVQNQFKIYIPTASATQINCYDGWSSLVYCGYLPI